MIRKIEEREFSVAFKAGRKFITSSLKKDLSSGPKYIIQTSNKSASALITKRAIIFLLSLLASDESLP